MPGWNCLSATDSKVCCDFWLNPWDYWTVRIPLRRVLCWEFSPSSIKLSIGTSLFTYVDLTTLFAEVFRSSREQYSGHDIWDGSKPFGTDSTPCLEKTRALPVFLVPTTKDSPKIWSKTIWQLNFKPRSNGCSNVFFQAKGAMALANGIKINRSLRSLNLKWTWPQSWGNFSVPVVVDGERSGYSNSTTVNYISDVMGCPQQFKECQSMPEHARAFWAMLSCWMFSVRWCVWCVVQECNRQRSEWHASSLRCFEVRHLYSRQFSDVQWTNVGCRPCRLWVKLKILQSFQSTNLGHIFIRRMFFSCFFICFGYPIWTVLRSS